MKTPLVSILMLTYNHEKYISDAIEGVLNQKTNFPIEIVIGEDQSTDSTREICKKYFIENPDRIRILDSEINLGGMTNFLRTLKECTGKYIAFCEGDDFWIDSFKVQKQVDFLEDNPEFALISSNKKVLRGETLFDETEKINTTGNIVEDLLISNFISTLTVLVRTDILKEAVKTVLVQANRRDWPVMDYPLWINIALNYKIGFINDVTGVYRLLPESLSHSLNPAKALAFDKWGIDVREYYYREYLKKNTNVPYSFRLKFKENIFHLKKRLLIDYGVIAKKEIFSLLKTNPLVYGNIIKKKLEIILF